MTTTDIAFKMLFDRWNASIKNFDDLLQTLLKQKFDGLPAEGWFEKHTKVSAEDFEKEPHRNKLNIILTRTTHLAYHTGQLILLK